MAENSLIPHLFRTEFGKITAVLSRQFGLAQMGLAEDIAADTFAVALEIWPREGIPPNPTAWLYTVAKNKARNRLRRDQLLTSKVMDHLRQEAKMNEHAVESWSAKSIVDSQLRMIFAVCHPVIPPEAQIALALRSLCGFGIDEIAQAFLTSTETINKRLYRARKVLREQKVSLDFPSNEDMASRLDTVLKTIYLLFSEGYYSETNNEVLRKDLCLEAMHLTQLLIENKSTRLPQVHAVQALMCFHASRFEARVSPRGEYILYDDQDRSRWDQGLIAKGVENLRKSATGSELSSYHLQAHIAYWHTMKEDSLQKWEEILHLYNRLLVLEYSPVAALNRTYALFKVKGAQTALEAAMKIDLQNNPYYLALLGELHLATNPQLASAHFQRARDLAKNEVDRQLMMRKLDGLGNTMD